MLFEKTLEAAKLELLGTAFMSSQQPTTSAPEADTPFRHYTLKHRVIAWISTRLFDGVTYTVRHGPIRGMKRKGGLGWLPAALSGAANTPEQQFWTQVDLAGKTVYDVGAFHGLLTLLFASRAKQVVCYEPNQHNRKRLDENLSLNHVNNVRVRPVGVGSSQQTVRMVFQELMPGGASINPGISEQLLHSNVQTLSQEIQVTTLDADIRENNLPAPDFIKIDIEGAELDALRGARATLSSRHPELFLEMHGETLAQKRRKAHEIVDYLTEMGYRSILHIETNSAITPENSEVAAEGHLYCRY